MVNTRRLLLQQNLFECSEEKIDKWIQDYPDDICFVHNTKIGWFQLCPICKQETQTTCCACGCGNCCYCGFTFVCRPLHLESVIEEDVFVINAPSIDEHICKLADNGWTIQFYKDQSGKYCAAAIPPKAQAMLNEAGLFDDVDDEFEEIMGDGSRYCICGDMPSETIRQLVDKCIFGKSK